MQKVIDKSMLTLNDLCERLNRVDEVSLLEILDINSEDIVIRFRDKIEERYDSLREDFEEEPYDE